MSLMGDGWVIGVTGRGGGVAVGRSRCLGYPDAWLPSRRCVLMDGRHARMWGVFTREALCLVRGSAS